MDGPMVASGTIITEILLFGGSIILLISAFYAGMWWLHRKFRKCSSSMGEQPFTTERLEEMLASGQISLQEFDMLHQGMLGTDANDTEKGISMSSHPCNVDDDNDKRGGDMRRPDKE